MLRAVIFDMDGVLIDSEPLWKLAEQKVFRGVGITLNDELCALTTGLEVKDIVTYWYSRHPWQSPSKEDVRVQIIKTVSQLVEERGEPTNGVFHALDYFKGKGLTIAVASSSPMSLIETTVKKLGIESYFTVMHSSQFEKAGKPDPAVYLGAARRLGVEPSECLAIEDSFRGVQSGYNAGMTVIAVPDPHLQGHESFKLANLVLGSLNEINDNLLKPLELL
jgi:mannitol-1-/sugar-/sorbitol-6-/2-deoxyglucose-6-phosphatase